MLTKEHLEILKKPFPIEKMGVKVQSLSKDKTKAMLVLYLQHTDVADRLEEVDPSWTAEPVDVKLDTAKNLYYVRLRLNLLGVSRENVGDGDDPKGAFSDALKRTAMLFGVGRFLYDSELVWVSYNENTDRFKTWTMLDYNQALFKMGKPPFGVAIASGNKPAHTPPLEKLREPVKPMLAVAPAPAPVAPPRAVPAPSVTSVSSSPKGISEAQIKRMHAIAKKYPENCWTNDNLEDYCTSIFRVSSFQQMTPAQYKELCDETIPKENANQLLSQALLMESPPIDDRGPLFGDTSFEDDVP